ncbi:hypothetical protein PRIPAC_86014, partial [Pristionchus pacificus]
FSPLTIGLIPIRMAQLQRGRDNVGPLPKVRGKAAPQYLEKGVLLNKRFRLDSLIGGGGFGQIYRAIDEESDKEVAVKVEVVCSEAGRMVLEQRVLASLLYCQFTPTLYASGNLGNYNYLVMEKLGPNITELRRKQPEKKLSLPVVTRVGVHITNALRELHSQGFLHRDIKPSNMCFGLNDKRYTVVLIDFGMTRQYKDVDGRPRPPRSYAAFRGTLRYVSINVHRRMEQGPCDDIMSLFYSIIELLEGELPWRLITTHEEISKAKEKVTFDQLARRAPSHFKDLYEYTTKQTSYDEMDYKFIISCLDQSDEEEIEKSVDKSLDNFSY